MESQAGYQGPPDPVGLGGGEPSARPLAPLISAELRDYAVAAFTIASLIVVLFFLASRYLPAAVPLLFPAGVVGAVAYLWSRVARLQRLCRTGTEVEGRLVGFESGDEGQQFAKYEYSFHGRTGRVTNNSWLGRRFAMRHGPRVIVLLDPRKPQDAVILGRLPNT